MTILSQWQCSVYLARTKLSPVKRRTSFLVSERRNVNGTIYFVESHCLLKKLMQKPEYKQRLEKGLVIMKKIDDQGYCWVRKDGGTWLKLVSVLQVAKFVKL